jgi:predicted TIM-barrel fold metal-dependent hydrolase
MSRVASGGPRLIDTDVHQSLPDLHQYLPRHWRDRWSAVGLGAGTGYVNPRGVLRRDTVPPGGGPPAGDPAFVVEDHLDRYGIDYAVLTGPFVLPLGTDPDYLNAVAVAVNDATQEGWLSRSPRFRGSVLVNSDDPAAAVREIERLGDRPEMVQVLMATTTRQPCGQRRYHPIYEAAAAYGLPVALHPGAEGSGTAAPRRLSATRRATWSGTRCCRSRRWPRSLAWCARASSSGSRRCGSWSSRADWPGCPS